VVSLFLSFSLFTPSSTTFFVFYYMYVCVRLSLLPSLFIKQIYSFDSLRFTFFFASFSSLASLSLKIISFGGSFVGHCPLFFLRLAILFSILFLHLRILPVFKSPPSSLVDNSSPLPPVSGSISKISITYVHCKPPQSDINININLKKRALPGLVRLVLSTFHYHQQSCLPLLMDADVMADLFSCFYASISPSRCPLSRFALGDHSI